MSAIAIQPRAAALPRPLKLAIGASVAVHALALLWQHGGLPPMDGKIPPTLQVVLKSATPIPQPPAEAHPAAQPVVPAPTARTRPVDTARTTPILSRPSSTLAARPAPAVHTATAPATSAGVKAPPEAPLEAPLEAPAEAAPRPPAPALAAAHVDTAPQPPTAEEAPDPAQLERYGRSLSSLLARQQNYPRIAALRGWEGEVQLRVTIARKGNIVATQIVRSSGFEVLDQNAVQLVSAAGPLPRPPEHLQNREIQVIVPVHYKLEKST